MWYKCLNHNCGYIFHSTEGCDKCPDCGEQDFREVAFDEQITNANSKVKPPEDNSNSSDNGVSTLEITRDNKPAYKTPEREL